MRRRDIERAKRRFLEAAADRDWLQGIGIAKVAEELGLVISVRPGAKSAASRMVNRLELDVPVTLRAIEEIRARPGGRRATAEAPEESLDSLREAARARLGAGRK